MRLRKILIAGSAIAAAAAFALVPAAQATTPSGPIGSIDVGANTTGNFPVTMALKSGTSVTMEVYGSPTKLGCSAGSAGGTVHAGTPAPNPAFNFSSLTLTCDSFIPGQDVVISVPSNGCARLEMADSNVHDGLVDTGGKTGKYSVVDGNLVFPSGCVVTVSASPCTVTVGGSTPVQFAEDKDPGSGVTQNLQLKGNGLTVLSAGFLCFGAVGVGDPLDLTSVNFNVSSTNGAIDFRL